VFIYFDAELRSHLKKPEVTNRLENGKAEGLIEYTALSLFRAMKKGVFIPGTDNVQFEVNGIKFNRTISGHMDAVKILETIESCRENTHSFRLTRRFE
jgi:hypothetical protein